MAVRTDELELQLVQKVTLGPGWPISRRRLEELAADAEIEVARSGGSRKMGVAGARSDGDAFGGVPGVARGTPRG